MAKDKIDKVKFHFITTGFSLKNRAKLKGFILRLLKKEGRSVDAINYIFCDDNYLLEINQQYLQHNTYTDIITFELSPKGHPLLSDIYISVERVKENAGRYETSFKRELHRVIFHGALHLSGYKDKTAQESLKMRQLEEACLKQYFVPRETGTSKH